MTYCCQKISSRGGMESKATGWRAMDATDWSAITLSSPGLGRSKATGWRATDWSPMDWRATDWSAMTLSSPSLGRSKRRWRVVVDGVVVITHVAFCCLERIIQKSVGNKNYVERNEGFFCSTKIKSRR